MSTQERMSIEDLARFLPEEARFVAMDSDDEWYWFDVEPLKKKPGWQNEGSRCGSILSVLPDIDLPWDQSLTEIRPKKRWRAEKGGKYVFVNDRCESATARESGGTYDNYRYACGNYWPPGGTQPQAQAYADAIKALAMQMHESGE